MAANRLSQEGAEREGDCFALPASAWWCCEGWQSQKESHFQNCLRTHPVSSPQQASGYKYRLRLRGPHFLPSQGWGKGHRGAVGGRLGGSEWATKKKNDKVPVTRSRAPPTGLILLFPSSQPEESPMAVSSNSAIAHYLITHFLYNYMLGGLFLLS